MLNLQNVLKKENFPAILIVLGLCWLVYQTGLFDLWLYSEEYGHGLMVVALLGYILYRRQSQLKFSYPNQAWLAYLVALGSLFLLIVGVASGISVISMYGVLGLTIAVTLFWGGFALLKNLIVPFLIIFLLIPLPNPFGPMLTSKLQLVSSQLGVWFIRLFGGTVYLEGNVLDMGGARLLVAEACAGLRYLFPLMSLGAIAAYLFNGPLWMRGLIFIITIPITVFLNSFRIGMTGILTEKWGTSHTEGMLHFFEGWVVFMCATILLVLFCWILLKLHDKKLKFVDAFAIDLPQHQAISGGALGLHGLHLNNKPWPIVLVVLIAAVITPFLLFRTEILPTRQTLTQFPISIAEWKADEHRLPPQTEAVAGASEYYYADFTKENNKQPVNVYVAFYETQRKGNIPHSPKVCIPGDGWNIDSSEVINIQSKNGNKISVNRLVISKDNVRIVSYYWLKQGSVAYTSELKARLSLVMTSLLERRTDGALVRLVTQLSADEDLSMADKRIQDFAAPFLDTLPKFVPN